MTSDDQDPARGFGARAGGFLRSHPRASAITGGVLALVLFGGGAVAAGAATGSGAATAARPSSAAPAASASAAPSAKPSPTPTVPARAVPASIPSAAPLRTCSVAAAAADSRLGTFEGTVIDPASGATLFDRNGQTAARTGSVMKTLTTAVALSVLGPNYRFTTKVTATGGTIALVGGGDATLSATPVGAQSLYTGAPKLATLAAEVKSKMGATPVTTIDLDDTYWNDSDSYDPSWPVTERTIGYQPEVVALMVDGDRANPTLETSPRSTDPVGRAGDAFRQALVAAGVAGASTAAITRGATTSTTVIAQVQSQPISTLIGQMIPNSDNTLAEMMARVSSKVAGNTGSAASLTSVYQAALTTTYGLSASTIKIIDGSGESYNDAVPPALVAQLMEQVLARSHNLGILYDALPISGETGTLAGRFTGANAIARGAVHAKTGSIASAYTLAGVIDARDGTKLTFAFYAIGNVSSAAMAALDTLTTAVYSCGANLSNQ